MAAPTPAYRIESDGKLYFKYNIGAEYELRPPVGAPFNYRVEACELDELTGKEYFRLESAGAVLPARFSVQQVELMLAQLPCTQNAEGVPQEIPLLSDEVKEFYDKKRKMRDKENVIENKKLKGTSWNKTLQARATVDDNLLFYRSQGNAAKVAELEKKLAELNAELNKILTEKNVDLRILTKAPDCTVCNDTGITDGKICECARKAAAAIKCYCAAKRLAKIT